MEVDSQFAPPDPSDEAVGFGAPAPAEQVALPIVSASADRPTSKSRAAMGVVVVLFAVAALLFAGRWTTGGERHALAGERDAALGDRDRLRSSLADLQRNLADVTAENSANKTMVEQLEAAAARDAAALKHQEASIAQLTGENDHLETTNRAQWKDIEAVSTCAEAVSAADAAVDSWEHVLDILQQIADAGDISPEQTDLDEQLDQAFVDLFDDEMEYSGAAKGCTVALDALPECDVAAAPLRLATESQESSCP